MSFSYSVSEGICTISVTPIAGYRYYRVYARYDDSSTDEYYDTEDAEGSWIYATSGFSRSFSIVGNRDFAVNVSYSSSNKAEGLWMGAQKFTTYTCYATIIFDNNGGSGGPPSIYDDTIETEAEGYIKFTMPATVPTRSGYSFAGWSYTGLIRQPGETLTVYGTTDGRTYTLTALWEQDGKVYIYNGSSWVKVTPYIYNGSSWVEATPYIYNGSSWVKI